MSVRFLFGPAGDPHDRAIANLSAYVDDRLTAGERVEVEAHLAACASCRAELSSLRDTVALLRAVPPVAAPRSFRLDPATVGAPKASGGDPRYSARFYVLRQATGALAAAFVAALALNLVAGPAAVLAPRADVVGVASAPSSNVGSAGKAASSNVGSPERSAATAQPRAVAGQPPVPASAGQAPAAPAGQTSASPASAQVPPTAQPLAVEPATRAPAAGPVDQASAGSPASPAAAAAPANAGAARGPAPGQPPAVSAVRPAGPDAAESGKPGVAAPTAVQAAVQASAPAPAQSTSPPAEVGDRYSPPTAGGLAQKEIAAPRVIPSGTSSASSEARAMLLYLAAALGAGLAAVGCAWALTWLRERP